MNADFKYIIPVRTNPFDKIDNGSNNNDENGFIIGVRKVSGAITNSFKARLLNTPDGDRHATIMIPDVVFNWDENVRRFLIVLYSAQALYDSGAFKYNSTDFRIALIVNAILEWATENGTNYAFLNSIEDWFREHDKEARETIYDMEYIDEIFNQFSQYMAYGPVTIVDTFRVKYDNSFTMLGVIDSIFEMDDSQNIYNAKYIKL